jgi:hypothetical protein
MIEELNQQLKSMYLEPKTKLRVDVDYVVARLEEMVREAEVMYSTDMNEYLLSIPKIDLEEFIDELKENMENHNKKLIEDKDYANGWRYIVWVGGNDNYYKTFSLAQMDYHNWLNKGYDDVFLTEMQKDGTEKVIYSSEENNGG